MGLTIHYKAKFAGTKEELIAKLEQLRQKCLDLPFAEVGKVFTKSLTSHVIDVWDSNQYQPNITVEQRDEALKEAGFDDCWFLIKAMDYDAKPQLQPCEIVGLSIWPGEGCESSNIWFYKRPRQKYWRVREFCKTQYATEFVRCHLLVVKLIDLADELSLGICGVHDEGEYYKSRDLKKLAESINDYTALISSIFGTIKETMGSGGQVEASIETCKNYMKVD